MSSRARNDAPAPGHLDALGNHSLLLAAAMVSRREIRLRVRHDDARTEEIACSPREFLSADTVMVSLRAEPGEPERQVAISLRSVEAIGALDCSTGSFAPTE